MIKGVYDSSQATAAKLADYLLTNADNFLVLMNGKMGSGKTTFTRMLAAELGIARKVTSPTFVGLHEYHEENLSLLHFDIYQVLVNYYDLKELLLQNPERKKIIVIEWAEKLEPEVVLQLEAEGLKSLSLNFRLDASKHVLQIEFGASFSQ